MCRVIAVASPAMTGQDWLIVWTAITAVATSATALAVWRRTVDWEYRPHPKDKGLDRVVNVGRGTARSVQVRVGSVGEPSDDDGIQQRERVRHGEAVPFVNFGPWQNQDKHGITVTWRKPFGRTGAWTYPLG